ncbi:translation initiation factor IF-2 subunit beta, partial [Candidatus Micrarchaeota archaeon]|nr:translation initiation factor IF-2 subunit beta [Candidatus Micrarchaeota archaeon]
GERAILQRKVQPQILNKKLVEFIKQYVVCNVCNKPDTHITSASGIKELVCEACGARRSVR